MKLAECDVREKLATFNQLKIFLYTLAAEYAPLFGNIMFFLEPRGYPGRAQLNLSGPAYKERKEAGKWALEVVAQVKSIYPYGNSRKKYHIFLDYQKAFPGDFACCGHGPQRLIIFGAMKFFHIEAKPLSEFYLVQASGDWPHMSIGLGLYLAKEYPDIEVNSVERMKDIIEGDAQNRRDESAAMMD